MQFATIVALFSMAVAVQCQLGLGGFGGPGFAGPGIGGPGIGHPGVVPPPPFGGLPVVPPIIPPFGLGFGGLGFGGLGLGLGLGFPFFPPFLGLGFGLGFGRFRGGFGRRGRGVEDMTKVEDMKMDAARAVVEPIVQCSISSEDKTIRCQGISHTFNCTVRPQISLLKSVELQIQDLDLIRRDGETSILRLVVPGKQITAVNPKTKEDISVTLWNGLESTKSAELFGFEVVDGECWKQVSALSSVLRPEELRVSLNIVA